jgi:hypothetical protein
MSEARIHICSFSSSIGELTRKQLREPMIVLRTIAVSPLLSTWEMENRRIREAVYGLRDRGFISEDRKEPYPWLRFEITDAGLAALAEEKPEGLGG